jgi:uncharacterized protein (TIGR03435 family)
MTSKWLLALMLACCGTGVAAPLPVYDAVVIKQNNSVTGSTNVEMDDSTFRAINVSLRHLLVNAYGIREGLIFGLPGWAASLRFDVYAKVTDPDIAALRSLSREQRQSMLAALLADRFHMQAHIETKTLPVYELIIAKNGPLLKSSAVQPDLTNPDRPGLGRFEVHRTEISATAVTLSELAGNLAFPLDRTVIDKTGLSGRYDFRLLWTADSAASDSNAAADAPPDLFTAIQLQLGLKLQPAKGPAQTLVIDHVQQPAEN